MTRPWSETPVMLRSGATKYLGRGTRHHPLRHRQHQLPEEAPALHRLVGPGRLRQWKRLVDDAAYHAPAGHLYYLAQVILAPHVHPQDRLVTQEQLPHLKLGLVPRGDAADAVAPARRERGRGRRPEVGPDVVHYHVDASAVRDLHYALLDIL